MNPKASRDEKIRIINMYVDTVKDRAIKEVCAFLLVGPPGTGKTTIVNQRLSGASPRFAPLHTTPLAFYCFVYENRDEILVIDDASKGILHSTIQALLKAMLWVNPTTNKATLSWDSTKELPKNVPNRFDFTGKLIFITNSMPNDGHAQAISSRVLSYDFDLTYAEKLEAFKDMAERYDDFGISTSVAQDIVSFITETTNSATRLDLRTFPKLVALAKRHSSTWRDAAAQELDVDPRYALLKYIEDLGEAMGMSVGVKAQAFEHIGTQRGLLGCKRSTFFTLRKRWLRSADEAAPASEEIQQSLEEFIAGLGGESKSAKSKTIPVSTFALNQEVVLSGIAEAPTQSKSPTESDSEQMNAGVGSGQTVQ